jgi:hypothetical protein
VAPDEDMNPDNIGGNGKVSFVPAAGLSGETSDYTRILIRDWTTTGGATKTYAVRIYIYGQNRIIFIYLTKFFISIRVGAAGRTGFGRRGGPRWPNLKTPVSPW